MSHRRLLGLLIGTALLAGCGGGGNTVFTPGGNNVVTPGPTPTPIPTPTPSPPPNGRAGLAGVSANYTGTLTETDTNNVIGASPVSTTSTAQVTSLVKTTRDISGNTVFTNTETDVAQLRTTSASIVATVVYQTVPAGTNVRTLSTVETDSSGAIFETDFGKNNGLVDILPEADGVTFTNDGGLTYKETDPGVNPGAVTTTRQQNPDGSYSSTTNTLDASGIPRTNTATEGVDQSGTYRIEALAAVDAGGNVTSLGRAFTFAAPVGAAPPAIGYYNLTAAGSLGSVRVQTQPGVNWLPNVTSLVSETDTISANQKLDTSCAPAAAFAGTATLVKQVVTTVDVVLGTIETRTTSAYDQFIPGTVCAVVSDSIQNFYDYSQQEGNFRLFPAQTATPVATVTVNETLSLQSVTPPSTSSSARSTSSLGAGLVLPHSLVASRVEHVVHQQGLRRLLTRRSAGGNQ
ncbi:MAG: hypothetical protein JWN27_4452 [Candidatus Eremiobacteraeota bacterium]|nr:hypothetical protein [Candidatus Eremiobacteraeota bacterium]